MKIKTTDIIEYIIMLINDFANYVGLTERQAYLYLKNHDAIQFIEKHYGIMHTLDSQESIDSLINFCRKSGGNI